MTRRPEKSCAQFETAWEFICRAVGNRCRPEPRSSPERTSTSDGAPGRPMIRDSCVTEISVGDGMASTSSSRAWTRYSAAASRGHRGNPQKHMTYRNSANVNPVGFHDGDISRRSCRVRAMSGYRGLVLNESMRFSLREAAKRLCRPDYGFEANSLRRRCASPATSAKSQSRNVTILGFVEVALGQTIQ
jgi:hypothetical protein